MGGFCTLVSRDRLSPDWIAWLDRQTLGAAEGNERPTWALLIGSTELPALASSPTLLERLAWILETEPKAEWVVVPATSGFPEPQGADRWISREVAARRRLNDLVLALGRWDPRFASDPSAWTDVFEQALRRRRVVVLGVGLRPAVGSRRPWETCKSLGARWGRWVRSHARSALGYRCFRLVEGLAAAGFTAVREIANRWGEDPWIARRTGWPCRVHRSNLEVRPVVPRDRIRILVAMHWLELGGAEKGAVDLIQRISRDRFCIYVTTDVPSSNSWEARIAPFAQEIWHLPTFLRRTDAPRFFDHLITSRGMDVLHIHHSAWAYESLPFLRRFHSDLVVLDTLHILELPPSPGGYPEWSAAQFEPFIDAHHVSSDFLGRFLRERWNVPDSKIRGIYTNVDTEFFDRASTPPGQFRNAWGIPSQAVVVAFTARFVPQKRPRDFLLMARHLWERWQAEGPERELRFVMAGAGPLKASCERLARRLELARVVTFPGEVEDMRALYRDADLVVLCSENEGIAFVSYEALAMGVPLIATDVGAQRELLAPEQLVPLGPDLPERLADAAWRMLSDSECRSRLVERGMRLVRGRHRLDDAIRDMEKLYEELLQRRNPAALTRVRAVQGSRQS